MKSQDVSQRVRDLERTVAEVTRVLNARERSPRVVEPAPVRWAVTCRTRQQVGTGTQMVYPAPPACRLPIKFLDADCNNAQEVAFAERAADQQNWAHATHWVPEGWRVVVFLLAGKYNALPLQYILRVRPNQTIAPNAAGPCTVIVSGTPTAHVIPQVYLDRCHGNQQITANRDALCAWFEEDRRFSFIGAECEP